MKGDFSRRTFNRKKHYSTVLMQQGRVQVDADWNEQQAINQHRQETEATDVIGKCGFPETEGGFAISLKPHKLYDVIFPKNQTVIGKKGWIVGDRGSIWVTEDSGDSWTEQKSGVVQDLLSVHFINAIKGWIVGQNGTILVTTDGGETWTQQTSKTQNDLNDVYFFNESKGWAVGDGGTILAATTDTTTRQITWNDVTPSFSNKNLNSVYFVDANTGWAVGDGGTILKATTDTQQQTAWSKIVPSPPVPNINLNSVYFVDANTGWAVGDEGTILKATLAGTQITWEAVTSPVSTPVSTNINLNSVCFVDANIGWAVGDEGTILKATTDTQQQTTWSIIVPSPVPNINLNSVCFVDANIGWSVGDGAEGNLLTYSNGSGSTKWSVKTQLKDFEISPGRIYVDGILCENEEPILFSHQLDFPGATLPEVGKDYLFYLDVWQRHITPLDDPQIQEVALGGADTATRTKTLWQVKAKQINNPTCSSILPDWASSTGKLNARTKSPETSTDLCKLPPNKGYKRLENQLYRVEIHKGGELGKNKVTFKWSRENSSVVTAIKKIDGKKLIVADLGKDEVLGFASNQWVEVIDDRLELNGEPGYLALVESINPDTREITLNTSISPDAIDMTRHPKLRRWDQRKLTDGPDVTVDGVSITPSTWMDLEEGIQVKFSLGTYKTGDYWLIPARTATADIEWPPYDSKRDPIPQSPLGVEHHYCRLAIATVDGTSWNIEDCRPVFSSLKELSEPSLFYVGGDGQEVMPVLPVDSSQTPQPPQLPQPLQVRVARGAKPVAGEKVTFTITKPPNNSQHNSQLSKDEQDWSSSSTSITIKTTGDGIATCYWKLDPSTDFQRVKAQLVGENNALPIYFSANLSLASQVAYEAECDALKDTKTVQEALDKLCGVYQPHRLNELAFGFAVGIGLALYILVACLLVLLPEKGISFGGFPLGDLLCCIPQPSDFNLGFCVIRAIINFSIGFGLGYLVAWCYNRISFSLPSQLR